MKLSETDIAILIALLQNLLSNAISVNALDHGKFSEELSLLGRALAWVDQNGSLEADDA